MLGLVIDEIGAARLKRLASANLVLNGLLMRWCSICSLVNASNFCLIWIYNYVWMDHIMDTIINCDLI